MKLLFLMLLQGDKDGYVAVFLRGGFNYTIYSNRIPTLKTSTFKSANGEEYSPFALKRGQLATGYANVKNATVNWINDQTPA